MKKLLLLTLLLAPGVASAKPLPWKVNYQGKLVNTAGIPVNGLVANMVFSIYNVATGGTALWTETQNNVPVSNGVFSVMLGAGTALSTAPFTNTGALGILYLGVNVAGDGEMNPRQQLVMTPYAGAAAAAMNDMGVQLIAGVSYATFTAQGNFLVPAGVVATTGSFNSGVTAGSGTFTMSGNAQFSIQTSSGIRMNAGTLLLDAASRGIDARGTGVVATTGTFAVVTATGVNNFSITTSSGIDMAEGTLRLQPASRGLYAGGTGIIASTGTFAVVTATGVNNFSIVTSSGIQMGGGALQVNGISTFNAVSSFTASGAAVWSITTSSGIQVNGQAMVSAGAFKGDGTLLSGLDFSLQGGTALTASQVWNVPAGTIRVLVLVVGGGGGGGGVTGVAGNFGAAGGGGGGGCSWGFADLTGVPNVTVTVSTGANGGAAGNNPGTAASPTSFGTYVVATGGAGGAGQAAGNTYAPVAGGAGGDPTSGTGALKVWGSDGGIGFRLSATTGHAGYGGASACAGGGEVGPPIAAAAGNNGRNYGGGGSGALSTAAVNRAGGNGAPGAVLIWQFK